MRASLPASLVSLGLVLLVSAAPGLARAGVLDHQWCRYSVGAWEIITDLPEHRVQPVVTSMRRVAQVFAHLHAAAKVPVTEPVQLWVFRNAQDYRRAIGDRHTSGLAMPSLNGVRLVFGPIQGRSDQEGLLINARHEFTHFLQRSVLDQQLPRWQEEGQASLLGNMKWRDDAQIIEFASVAPISEKMSTRQIQRLLTSSTYPLQRLAKAQEFYRISQMLATETLRRNAEASLKRGEPNKLPKGLWQQHQSETELVQPLPKFSTQRLGQNGSPKLTLRFKEPFVRDLNGSPTQQVNCLDRSNLSIELASLLAKLNPKRAKRLLDGIPLQEREQTSWLVQSSRVIASTGDHLASAREAERALALSPNEPTAQIQLGNALVGRCWALVEEGCIERWRQAEKLYRSALQQLPDRFDAIYGLGLARLHTGLPGEGLNYLRIAYQRAPWSVLVNFYLGEAYRLVGDPKANIHLRKAAAWSEEPVWRKRAERALELLTKPHALER